MGLIYEAFVREPFRDLARRPTKQIPALDALRTCAVMTVVLGHLCEVYPVRAGRENALTRLPVLTSGWYGVDLFFVLSGYFIGRQLWRELHESGTINFGRFIVRRGFRIWPLYIFFLIFVLAVLGPGDLPYGRWWSDAVFLTNYYPDQGVIKGSWSLCTEEQFYTITPLLLIFAAPRIGSVRGFRKYLVALLVLEPLVRAVSWWSLTGDLARHDPDLFVVTLYQPIHTHADGLVMGLLLANLEVTGSGRSKRGFFATGWCVLVALVACAGLRFLQRELFNFTGAALVFGAVIWFLLARRCRWLSWLDAVPFYWLSRLSYGMYLNHTYIMDPVVDLSLEYLPLADRWPTLHNVVTLGFVTALSVAAALVTFCLVESPFLRLRQATLDRRRKVPGDGGVVGIDPGPCPGGPAVALERPGMN